MLTNLIASMQAAQLRKQEEERKKEWERDQSLREKEIFKKNKKQKEQR